MSARSSRELASLTVRHAAAWIGATSGWTVRRLNARRGHVAVLMYHRIVADDADVAGVEPGMYVRESAFESQLRWLRQQCRVRTLGEILDAPPATSSPPEVAITFDDGWRDNLTVAWPLLERYGLRGTIFVVRDWVAAGRNDEGEFVRPSELAELVRCGMEIGAHTVTHPRLDAVDERSAEAEMRESKQAVEDWTGRACRSFAYPYGAHDERTVECARGLFEASVVVGGGWWAPSRDDPARLPRIGIHQDMSSTSAMFAARVATWCC